MDLPSGRLGLFPQTLSPPPARRYDTRRPGCLQPDGWAGSGGGRREDVGVSQRARRAAPLGGGLLSAIQERGDPVD